MMDITHLASFYEVVQRGSFSAAADALGVSKGMLSRHVSALESALNAQLLQRTTRRLSLTEAGRLVRERGIPFAAVTAKACGLSYDEFSILQKSISNLRGNLMAAAKAEA